jgi:hypothetical protein
MAPPPNYPPIQGSLSPSTNNLFLSYVDMLPSDLTSDLNEVNSEKLRAARFGHVVPLEIFHILFSS